MAYVRLTLVKPKPGRAAEVLEVLRDLDHACSGSGGLMFSMVLQDGEVKDSRGRLGRLSLWRSKKEANQEARRDRTLALRAALQRLTEGEGVESMLRVYDGWPAEMEVPDEAQTEPHRLPVASGRLKVAA